MTKKNKVTKTSQNCSNCNESLENNLSTFAEVLKSAKGKKAKALKLQQHEFACLECNHEWGKVMGSQPKLVESDKKSPMQKKAEGKSETPILDKLADDAPDDIVTHLPEIISKKTGVAIKQYTNHSTVDKPVGRVHELAMEMLEKDPAARRKDIVAACVAIGINIHTAKTQVQVYLKGLKDDAAAKLAASLEGKEAASA